MRALITGSEGFVGKYLREELNQNGYTVTGVDIRPGEGTVTANLLNTDEVRNVLAEVRPEVIIHLAGQANVGKSWKSPQLTIDLNINAAVNLMEAAREFCPQASIVLVGSSDEYGDLRELGASVNEELPLRPMNPYAISKVAQENMGKAYAKAYGMRVCMTRSFNHGGAGQMPGFMIPDFASGIVRVERGEAVCVRVGNLSSKRDFTHVKDVVRAYRLIAEKGRAGEVYNVGSGTTYSAQEILDRLLSFSNVQVHVEQDPERMRPSDTPVICCDHTKITLDTGWKPIYSISEMLQETMDFYRSKYNDR